MGQAAALAEVPVNVHLGTTGQPQSQWKGSAGRAYNIAAAPKSEVICSLGRQDSHWSQGGWSDRGGFEESECRSSNNPPWRGAQNRDRPAWLSEHPGEHETRGAAAALGRNDRNDDYIPPPPRQSHVHFAADAEVENIVREPLQPLTSGEDGFRPDADDADIRMSWKYGAILEVYSASAHRWYPARVAQVDEEGTLTVLFYIDGEAKQKTMGAMDSQLCPYGVHTTGDLPPGFHIKPSQSRPGQVVYLDATTGQKYATPELAWEMHFERLRRAANAGGLETICPGQGFGKQVSTPPPAMQQLLEESPESPPATPEQMLQVRPEVGRVPRDFEDRAPPPSSWRSEPRHPQCELECPPSVPSRPLSWQHPASAERPVTEQEQCNQPPVSRLQAVVPQTVAPSLQSPPPAMAGESAARSRPDRASLARWSMEHDGGKAPVAPLTVPPPSVCAQRAPTGAGGVVQAVSQGAPHGTQGSALAQAYCPQGPLLVRDPSFPKQQLQQPVSASNAVRSTTPPRQALGPHGAQPLTAGAPYQAYAHQGDAQNWLTARR
mmetsp:Transcript_13057/g.29671  ORF Transcript_13057/g.29671 Transcript_13057/m.29671 type:complete len:549 (-) Transcript_13057:9-1655(-)